MSRRGPSTILDLFCRRGHDRMPSRRTFLGAAAATIVLPFAEASRAAAAQRTILNDASRLSPTPVAKHITISKPPLDDLVERIRAELKEAARRSGRSRPRWRGTRWEAKACRATARPSP